MTYKIPLFFALLLCMVSCGKRIAKEQSNEQPPIYPDYANVTIPANIAPLNFTVNGAEHLEVAIMAGGQIVMEAQGGGHIELPESKWAEMLQQNKGKDIEVTVSVWSKDHPEGVAYKPFRIYIDESSIDDYVAYRLLPPGFVGWDKMAIMQRQLSSFEESVIVENTQNEEGCVNCHNFCQGDPNVMMFHARNANGGTIIQKNGKLEKAIIKNKALTDNATYPNWHPGGRYIAFSVNKVFQNFYSHCKQKIEVCDASADLLIYDTQTKKVLEDKRFNDSLNVETFPTFSPDGKYLYFCTSTPVNLPFDSDSLKFSIVRVPFNVNNGSLGAKVDTVYNAAKYGQGAMQPKISPDGRYLLISCAAGNTFHVHYPESDMKVVDLKTNELIEPENLNDDSTAGYHSWSSNGKWIVFASKRTDGHPTRLFFALFKDGKCGKPFMLPQQNPEEDACRFIAYNVPEFIKGKVVIDKDKVSSLLTH